MFVLTLLQIINAQNPCVITVPPNPLSEKGLATPWEVTGCDQTNTDQTSFVQGAIFDPAKKTISIYNPLMINKGTKPAVAPTPVKLPPGAVVGLWIGSNNDAVHLTGAGVKEGKCVNGLGNSDFGQMSFCNAAKFFQAAKVVKSTALGKDVKGRDCPTVRDFAIIDQDQSDNVDTQYLIVGKQLAQNTAANRKKLNNATVVDNGSDNALLGLVQDAIGCKPFTAPDLADNRNAARALTLNELQASQQQKAPIALVPLNDPMTLLNGKTSVTKTNLYRVNVLQNNINKADDGTLVKYCKNFLDVAPKFIIGYQDLLVKGPTPDAATGDSLGTFMCGRFVTSWNKDGGLDCAGALNIATPIDVVTDKNGVVTSCSLAKRAPNTPPSNNNGTSLTNTGNANNGNANTGNANNGNANTGNNGNNDKQILQELATLVQKMAGLLQDF
ncbi:hypothetical protein HDV01_002662 [Terramyces sp. JEL0728]|nr:hypothetical protein HDV01_002662 [Terramyces sp. JEL0728]